MTVKYFTGYCSGEPSVTTVEAIENSKRSY